MRVSLYQYHSLHLILILLSFSFVLSCKTVKETTLAETKEEKIREESTETKELDKKENDLTDVIAFTLHEKDQVFVYQTVRDYEKLVPVILSKNKTEIISYPEAEELFSNGKIPYPSQLVKGYLLAKQKVSKDMAFLNITYEEYSKRTFSGRAELYEYLLDKNPLLKLYNCGSNSSYSSLVLELNSMILKNDLSNCKCLTK